MKTIPRKLLLCYLGLAVLGVGVTRAEAADAADEIAVIVSKTTALVGLSSNDLKTIYLGEKEHWPTGQKVVVIALASGRPELKAFLKRVCGMSEGDYKKYFIQANFTGKTLILPRVAESPSAVKAIVSTVPGSIGFVRVSDLDGTVGVIKIDGLSPGDAGYKLLIGQ